MSRAGAIPYALQSSTNSQKPVTKLSEEPHGTIKGIEKI